MSVFSAPLGEVLSRLGKVQLGGKVKPHTPALPPRLSPIVTLLKTSANGDLLGVVAVEGAEVCVSTCELGRSLKMDRYRPEPEQTLALQRSRVEELMSQGFRLEAVAPNDAFALLTPPVSAPKPVPERALIADDDGPIQIGGSPAEFPRDRWPPCPGCERPLSFFFRFEAELVGLQRHSAVSAFLCEECMDPTATAAVLERPSAIKWKKSVGGRAKQLPTSHARAIRRSDTAKSYVGGKAQFIQSGEGGTCRYCGAEQRFVAQLDSSLNPGLPLGDSGRAYLFICPAEHEALLRWDCH